MTARQEALCRLHNRAKAILRDAVPLAARRPHSPYSEAVLAVARADVALLADVVAVIQRLPAPVVRRDPLIDVGRGLAAGERTVLDVLHDQDCLRENERARDVGLLHPAAREQFPHGVIGRYAQRTVIVGKDRFGRPIRRSIWEDDDDLLDMRFGALVIDEPDDDSDPVPAAGGLADVRIDADGQLVTDDPRTARIFTRDGWGAPQELDESTWEERSDDLLDEFGVPDARHDDLEHVESVGPRRLVKRSTHRKAPLRGVHPDRPWAPTSTLRRAKDGLLFVDEPEAEPPAVEQVRRSYFEMLDEALEQDAWEAGYEAGEAAEALLDEGVVPGWVNGERSAVLAPERQLAWDLQPDGVLHGRQPDISIRSLHPWALKQYTRSRRAHQRAGASVAAVAFSTPLYAAVDRASRVPPSSPLGELFYALRCGDIDLLSGRSPFRPTRWTYR